MNDRIRNRIKAMLKTDSFKKMTSDELLVFLMFECPNNRYAKIVIKNSRKDIL